MDSTGAHSVSMETQGQRESDQALEELENLLRNTTFPWPEEEAEAADIRAIAQRRLNDLRSLHSTIAEEITARRNSEHGGGTQRAGLDHVVFNAGGTLLACDASRWNLAECGLLGRLLSGGVQPCILPDGAIFLDCDPSLLNEAVFCCSIHFSLSTWYWTSRGDRSLLSRVASLFALPLLELLVGDHDAAVSRRLKRERDSSNENRHGTDMTLEEFRELVVELQDEIAASAYRRQKYLHDVDVEAERDADEERRRLDNINPDDAMFFRYSGQLLAVSERRVQNQLRLLPQGLDGVREVPLIPGVSCDCMSLYFDLLRCNRSSDETEQLLWLYGHGAHLLVALIVDTYPVPSVVFDNPLDDVFQAPPNNRQSEIGPEGECFFTDHISTVMGTYRCQSSTSCVWCFVYSTETVFSIGITVFHGTDPIGSHMAQIGSSPIQGHPVLCERYISGMPHGVPLALTITGSSAFVGLDGTQEQTLLASDLPTRDCAFAFTVTAGPHSRIKFI